MFSLEPNKVRGNSGSNCHYRQHPIDPIEKYKNEQILFLMSCCQLGPIGIQVPSVQLSTCPRRPAMIDSSNFETRKSSSHPDPADNLHRYTPTQTWRSQPSRRPSRLFSRRSTRRPRAPSRTRKSSPLAARLCPRRRGRESSSLPCSRCRARRWVATMRGLVWLLEPDRVLPLTGDLLQRLAGQHETAR